MTTPAQKKRTIRQKPKPTTPETPKPLAPETPTPPAPEIPAYALTRQEVAPIAVELFKVYSDVESAAKQAVALLRACDRAIETDSVRWKSDFLTQKMIDAQKKAESMPEKQIKALSPKEQWENGLKVPFGKLVENATEETTHKRRAKKKFMDFIESSVTSAGKEWPKAKADQIGAHVEKLWGYFIMNPLPSMQIDPLNGLLLLLLEFGLPDQPENFFERFSFFEKSGRISKNPDKRSDFPDKKPIKVLATKATKSRQIGPKS